MAIGKAHSKTTKAQAKAQAKNTQAKNTVAKAKNTASQAKKTVAQAKTTAAQAKITQAVVACEPQRRNYNKSGKDRSSETVQRAKMVGASDLETGCVG